MSTDWLKCRVDLDDEPEVIGIARLTRIDAFGVVGRLMKVWGWAQRVTVDGSLPHVTAADVDTRAKRKGFAEAMQSVGWLAIEDGRLVIPKFDRHNGTGAKRRAADAVRKTSARDADKTRTIRGRHADILRTKCGPEKEKEEEEDKKHPPNPPPGGAWVLFDRFWAGYPRKESKGPARKAWGKLELTDNLWAAIVAGLAGWNASDQWRRGVIPHPATWLNQRKWEDETFGTSQHGGPVRPTGASRVRAEPGKYAGIGQRVGGALPFAEAEEGAAAALPEGVGPQAIGDRAGAAADVP